MCRQAATSEKRGKKQVWKDGTLKHNTVTHLHLIMADIKACFYTR